MICTDPATLETDKVGSTTPRNSAMIGGASAQLPTRGVGVNEDVQGGIMTVIDAYQELDLTRRHEFALMCQRYTHHTIILLDDG